MINSWYFVLLYSQAELFSQVVCSSVYFSFCPYVPLFRKNDWIFFSELFMLWAIAPVVIDTQNMFHTCHLSQRGHLRYICPFFVYHFLCPSVSGKPLTFSHEILYKIFHAPLYWEGAFWVLLRPILACVPLFLENSSVCSHEILFRCFWYYSDGHYTKISPSYPSILVFIFGYFGAHLGICSSTYREMFNIFLWNFIDMFFILL